MKGLVARFIDEAGLPLATRQAAALAQLAKLDPPFDPNAAAVPSAEEFSRRFGEALLANPDGQLATARWQGAACCRPICIPWMRNGGRR
jgi:hypothetical protein